MAIAVVQSQIAGADVAATSKAVTLTQPAAGNLCVTVGGAWTALSSPTEPDVVGPSGITERAYSISAGNWGVVAGDLVATGSGETSFGIDNTASDPMAVVGLNLSGAGALTTKGEANSAGTPQDGITVTAEGVVAADGSLAIACFFRRGTIQGGTPITREYSSGWSELTFVADFVSPADEAELYVATKTVNIADGTVSCQLNPSGTYTNFAAILLIYPPSNAAPTLTDPGAKRILRGGDTITGLGVADPDGGDITMTFGATNGVFTLPGAAAAGITINSGSGTGTLEAVGTVAEWTSLFAQASPNGLVYTNNTHTADTITVDADDDQAASATQVSLSVTMIDGRISASTMADLNAVLATLAITEASAKTVVMTAYAIDSGDRTDTDNTTVTVTAPASTGAAITITELTKVTD